MFTLRHYAFKNYILEVAVFNEPGAGGGQKFAKFVTLAQFYYLSIFFMLHHLGLTFSHSVANIFLKNLDKRFKDIKPFPKCNEDPDCRNPRGFRIANYITTSVSLIVILVVVFHWCDTELEETPSIHTMRLKSECST